MTTAAATPVRRPLVVTALTVLLAVTAIATVAVELLNWWYAPERGFGLAVRTGWALLRSLGFAVLIWHVRRGRVVARPFGLILAVTTVFAVGRLLVPRAGVPPLPGVLGFAALTLLCVAVVGLLYRSLALREVLVRHPNRLVVDRRGIFWRELAPRRPPVAAWLLTVRIAAFTYSPLMLVPCLVAVGTVLDGRLVAVPLVVGWGLTAVVVSQVVLFGTFFLLRGRRWARALLAAGTVAALAVDLPLCWLLLGLDGLVRDGAPLAVAAGITLFGLRRAGRDERPVPAGTGATPRAAEPVR
ncbi:hypothetical protein AB0J86_21365 [Micromonospora sp. NPDC049559]|uniref:hypothetical protein n=1 Tax=Micromonospora sp. NPDC049559 TaxID=3155923 RepID=UPI00342B1F04